MYTRIGLVPHLPLFAIRLFHSASTMYTYNSPLPGVLSYSLEKEKRSSLIPKNFRSGIESLEENADLFVSINLPTFPTFRDPSNLAKFKILRSRASYPPIFNNKNLIFIRFLIY